MEQLKFHLTYIIDYLLLATTKTPYRRDSLQTTNQIEGPGPVTSHPTPVHNFLPHMTYPLDNTITLNIAGRPTS